jgi:hypothetical protein
VHVASLEVAGAQQAFAGALQRACLFVRLTRLASEVQRVAVDGTGARIISHGNDHATIDVERAGLLSGDADAAEYLDGRFQVASGTLKVTG